MDRIIGFRLARSKLPLTFLPICAIMVAYGGRIVLPKTGKKDQICHELEQRQRRQVPPPDLLKNLPRPLRTRPKNLFGRLALVKKRLYPKISPTTYWMMNKAAKLPHHSTLMRAMFQPTTNFYQRCRPANPK